MGVEEASCSRKEGLFSINVKLIFIGVVGASCPGRRGDYFL